MTFPFTPLVVLTLSFIAGIIAGNLFSSHLYLPIAAVLVTLSVILRLLKKPNYLFPTLFYLSAVFFGSFYYSYGNRIPADDVSRLIVPPEKSADCVLVGSVISYPETRENRTEFILACDGKVSRGKTKVSVYARDPVEVNYGDRVRISGKLSLPSPSTNPGVFDYKKFLARQGIFSVFSVAGKRDVEILEKKKLNFFLRLSSGIRERIDSVIDKTMPPPEALVLKGMMLGQRKGLPQEIQDVFVDSGVAHILATQCTKNICRQFTGRSPLEKPPG